MKGIVFRAAVILLAIGLCSCNRNVEFSQDYFDQPDRLSFDKTLLGYYLVSREHATQLVFILQNDPKTYVLCFFDLSETKYEKNNHLNLQTIKINDLYLAKLSDPSRSMEDQIMLLKYDLGASDLNPRAVLLNYESEFLAPFIRNKKLKGKFKDTTQKGEKAPEIIVTATYDEFVNFIKENYAVILGQFKNNEIADEKFAIRRISPAPIE